LLRNSLRTEFKSRLDIGLRYITYGATTWYAT